MKVLILLSFLAMAAARPEAGYSYSRPQQQQQSHHHSVSHNGYNHNGEFKIFQKKRNKDQKLIFSIVSQLNQFRVKQFTSTSTYM
jgi:hypothetical protein